MDEKELARERGRAEGWREAALFLESMKRIDIDGEERDMTAEEFAATALMGVRACADKLTMIVEAESNGIRIRELL